jgi:hypothetical protein
MHIDSFSNDMLYNMLHSKYGRWASLLVGRVRLTGVKVQPACPRTAAVCVKLYADALHLTLHQGLTVCLRPAWLPLAGLACVCGLTPVGGWCNILPLLLCAVPCKSCCVRG